MLLLLRSNDKLNQRMDPIYAKEGKDIHIAMLDAQIKNTFTIPPTLVIPFMCVDSIRTVTQTNYINNSLTVNKVTGLQVGSQIKGFSGTFGHITNVNLVLTVTKIVGNELFVKEKFQKLAQDIYINGTRTGKINSYMDLTFTLGTRDASYTGANLAANINNKTAIFNDSVLNLTMKLLCAYDATKKVFSLGFVSVQATSATIYINNFTNRYLGFESSSVIRSIITTLMNSNRIPKLVLTSGYQIVTNLTVSNQSRRLVLARVPLNAGFNKIDNYILRFPLYKRIPERVISRVEITILDDDGNTVSTDWAITLGVIQKKSDPINVTI